MASPSGVLGPVAGFWLVFMSVSLLMIGE
jgi:hypothetical protein